MMMFDSYLCASGEGWGAVVKGQRYRLGTSEFITTITGQVDCFSKTVYFIYRVFLWLTFFFFFLVGIKKIMLLSEAQKNT